MSIVTEVREQRRRADELRARSDEYVRAANMRQYAMELALEFVSEMTIRDVPTARAAAKAALGEGK